jgi:hypothetical protein
MAALSISRQDAEILLVLSGLEFALIRSASARASCTWLAEGSDGTGVLGVVLIVRRDKTSSPSKGIYRFRNSLCRLVSIAARIATSIVIVLACNHQ